MLWQVDFYRRPLKEDGQTLWELLICNSAGSSIFEEFCRQSEVNANWLVQQLEMAISSSEKPDKIQVFRPQSLSLLTVAGKALEIEVEATRRTYVLKELLKDRSHQYSLLKNYTGEPYNPLALDKPPPVPLPEKLWGERWRFATIAASDIEDSFTGLPIPIREIPEFLLPINLGISSTLPVPGVVIDGGRQSMKLARWIQQTDPVSLQYISGAPDGLILEAGLVDRWIVATFEDPDVIEAAKVYEQRKEQSKGLHFLLVQPDDSGMTYSGFWLLGDND